MQITLLPDRFAWPIVTIDFEASGLGRLTYPIEIGMSRWQGPGHVGETWHSLIRPDPTWTSKGVWNDVSQTIHGIERDELADAPTPAEVLKAANGFAPLGTLAFCDGGGHDSYWLQRLADAAGFPPTFLLGPWNHVADAMHHDQQFRLQTHRSDEEIAHRAAPDAEDHIKAFAWALGCDEPVFVRRDDVA
jgi:hypothetical protein